MQCEIVKSLLSHVKLACRTALACQGTPPGTLSTHSTQAIPAPTSLHQNE